MKLNPLSLFALLPLLPSAAPLVLLVKPIVSSAAGIVSINPLPSSIAASALAQVSATAIAGLNTGISAVGNNGVTGSINSGSAVATGTYGAVVDPITTGTPSQLLQYLNTYISGVRPIALDSIVTELNTLTSNLNAGITKATTDITNGLYLQNYTYYTAKLISNLNIYLKSLPSTVTSASSFKTAISKLDVTLAALVSAEKVSVGASGANAFAQALINNGVTNVNQLATVLPKTVAVLPPLNVVVHE